MRELSYALMLPQMSLGQLLQHTRVLLLLLPPVAAVVIIVFCCCFLRSAAVSPPMMQMLILLHAVVSSLSAAAACCCWRCCPLMLCCCVATAAAAAALLLLLLMLPTQLRLMLLPPRCCKFLTIHRFMLKRVVMFKLKIIKETEDEWSTQTLHLGCSVRSMMLVRLLPMMLTQLRAAAADATDWKKLISVPSLALGCYSVLINRFCTDNNHNYYNQLIRLIKFRILSRTIICSWSFSWTTHCQRHYLTQSTLGRLFCLTCS